MTRQRLFCVVRSATSQWWAGRGHRKVRRLPVTPVVPTPFSPPPLRLEPLVVGLIPLQEAALWLQPSTRLIHY